MVICTAAKCGNNFSNRPDCQFFRLPLEPERRNVWLEQMDRKDLIGEERKNKRICSDHFESHMITIQRQGLTERKVLTPNAVPTIFGPPSKRQARWQARQSTKQARPTEIDQPQANEQKTRPIQIESGDILGKLDFLVANFQMKVELLRSLCREEDEIFSTYLSRIENTASILKSTIISPDEQEWSKVLFVAGLKQDEASICLNQPHDSLEMMTQRLTKQFAMPTVQGHPVQIRIKPVAIEEDMETDNLFTDDLPADLSVDESGHDAEEICQVIKTTISNTNEVSYDCELCLESGGRVSFGSRDALESHISEFHSEMRQNFRRNQAEALTKNTEGMISSSKRPKFLSEIDLSDENGDHDYFASQQVVDTGLSSSDIDLMSDDIKSYDIDELKELNQRDVETSEKLESDQCSENRKRMDRENIARNDSCVVPLNSPHGPSLRVPQMSKIVPVSKGEILIVGPIESHQGIRSKDDKSDIDCLSKDDTRIKCKGVTFQSNNAPKEASRKNLNDHKRGISTKPRILRKQLNKTIDQPMKWSTTKEPIQCELCPTILGSMSYYQAHKRQVHLAKRDHLCSVCHKAFKRKGTLKKHMNTHTGVKPYQCEKCAFSCASRGSFKRHERMHQSENEKIVFLCPECNEFYTQKGHLKTHLENKHGKQLKECETKTVAEIRALGEEPRNGAGRKKQKKQTLKTATVELMVADGLIRISQKMDECSPERCQICGFEYTHVTDELAHSNAEHEGKRFACNVCGERYMSEYNFDIHMFRKHKVQPAKLLECGICDFNSVQSTSRPTYFKMTNHLLEKHSEEVERKEYHSELENFVRGVHERIDTKITDTYFCDACGKHFLNRKCFRDHLRTHSESKKITRMTLDECDPTKENQTSGETSQGTGASCVCHTCGKVFKKPDYLRNHIARTHQQKWGQKIKGALPCAYCDVVCHNNQHLKEHINGSHLNIRQFHCRTCDTWFVTSNALVYHIGSKHMTNNKMEWEKIRNEDDNLAQARAHSAFEYKPATESEIAKAWETFGAMVQDSKQHVMDWRNRVSLGRLAPDQTPAKSFDCSTCGSRFVYKNALIRHLKTHGLSVEERKIIECEFCDRKFNGYSGVETHMKIKHFKIKEHFCTVCNTGFGNNSNLLEHIAVKHMEFKDGKEWRANVTAENKARAKAHPAHSYRPATKKELSEARQALLEQRSQMQ